MTGNVFRDVPIRSDQARVDKFYKKYIETDTEPDLLANVPEPGTKEPEPVRRNMEIDKLLNVIRRSKSGELFKKLFDRGDITGYKSQSEADQALMNMLPFYTGGDPDLMRKIFSLSALARREKWKRKYYQDKTIQTALKSWDGTIYDPATYAKEKAKMELQDTRRQWEGVKNENLQAAFFCENNDAGNGDRIYLFSGNDWRYDAGARVYYHFNNIIWEECEGAELVQTAIQVFRLLIKAAEADEIECENQDVKDSILGYLKKSLNMSRIRPSIEAFRSMILITGKQFNCKPFFLNTPTNTIDLLTNEYHNHTRADYITQVTAADVSNDYKGGLWKKTVAQIIPDAPTRQWLQCFTGIFLCGDVSEEIVLIAYGEGGRGKGTFFETIAAALGDYATTIPVEVILKSNHNANGQAATPEIVKLKGKRLALCTESGTSSRLNEAKLKWLTGGDMLTARQLYARSETFIPTHKLVISTNYLPHVADSTDSGLNRRIAIVPFNADIEPIRNNALKAELRKPENLADVLAWLMEGFKIWQSKGGLPEKSALMLEAESKFRSDNDIIGAWVKENCRCGSEYEYNVTDALKAVNEWLSAGKTTNERITRRDFSQLMERHGFCKIRKNNGRFFIGLEPVTKQ